MIPTRKFVRNAFQSTNFRHQTNEQRKKIDAVIFSIWALGYQKRPRMQSFKITILSMLIRLLSWPFSLPGAVLKRTPEFIFSGIVAWLMKVATDGMIEAWPSFILVAALLFRKEVIWSLRTTLFNIGDVMTFSALTRRIVENHLLMGPIRELNDPNDFLAYVANSRIPVTNDPYEDELAAILDVLSEGEWDWDRVEILIDGYWEAFPDDPKYWRSAKKAGGA